MSYGLRKAKLHRDKDESRKEAEASALAIVDYWAGKGYDVKAWVEPRLNESTSTKLKGIDWDIRSDLGNGLPVRKRPLGRMYF